MLTEARPAGESKNTDMASNDQRNTSRDSLQFQCKSLHMFQTMFQVRFPNIQRKRRSVGSNIAISSTSAAKDIVQHETITQHIPGMSSSEIRSDYLCSMLPGVRGATIEKPDENLPREVHTPQWLAESNHSKKLRRKRSKTITRARNFRSLKRILKGILPAQDRAASDKPQRLEAIVSEMQSTVSRKKRTKRNSIMSRLHARRLQIQWRAHLRHRPTSFLKSIGTSPDGLCKTLFSIDTICEWFEQLEINRESPYIRQNALILHRTRHQERNSLVLCRRDGSIIPYGRFSYPPRRKLPRPMVMLDDETTRVWKLLMVNINSEGIDGTNEEKEKWWGEERTVFHGRANSFIARMRLVQGDRRFSPWKGSVVDSVIGVFLTQNVSDHLSSSAFMAMAAEFPNKLNSNKRPCNEEWGSSLTHEPLLYLEDSGDVGSAPSIFNPSGIIVHEINHEEDNDAVSSDETSTISGSFTSSTGESRVLPLNSPKNGLETNFSSETKEHGEDKGEILEPSQDSLTYQDSKNLRLEINVDTTGLCSTSKTEKRDCTDGFSLNSSVYPCSELLDPSQGTIQQRHGRGSISQLDSISVNKLFLLETAERESQIPNNYQIHSSQGISTISSSPPTSQFVLNQDMLDNSEPLRNKTVEDSGLMSNYQQEENYVLQSQNKEGNRRLEKLVHTERSLREILGMTENTSLHENQLNIQSETSQSEMEQMRPSRRNDRKKTSTSKSKGRTTRNEKDFDWDSLRRQAENGDLKRERTARTMDSVDWEAVRCADVDKIAKTIRPRGMNNMLSERIKDFLHRLVREHGSIDLEWLRDIPPDKAKEYLLSIKGLGLKSVECVRLLTLHHLAFPVDTNVGRIAVRLGWVPLQPLPESLQLHLLELYPILESIQQYLWPRLCKLDQETLYQLHYHMITFGKVFCTKSKPNCNACPLRGECRHFASAFASARLALPGPEEKRIIRADEREAKPEPVVVNFQQSLFLPPGTDRPQTMQTLEALNPEAKSECKNCEPIIEEPATPEPECTQELAENDIEDISCDDAEEIPTIRLNMEAFTKNLQNLQMSTELREGDLSKALVALSTEAASTPMPKLKNFSRLRTEHQVYELPDSHRLLERLDKREPDDPCSYLLAIWTPGETANSIQPPEKRCVRRENNTLCQEKTCFSCNSIREEKSQIVRGTLLIPCRTAMRGSFPLNGTYFQVNEVFADHGSSLNPIEVPRDWIWNLRRRTVYFGTSITAIFRGLTTEAIQRCFWRGYVCVRGFDQKTRAQRPLMARLRKEKLQNQ
ncbi:PREDICTED: transcriptional activator DEMETER [Tarenaya hassleriana]|uniref:transcriptional activator DEMETER n=1 Tax=Tarenaya hassleriana TaxID=28532 RepID=UPI00053C69F6|nr:PREDICTED: transcriptional activator DEMETER [Tarenaya hassleriana]